MVSLIKQKILLSLALKQQDLEHMSRLIQSLDYQQVLNRGFSITKTQAGKVIKASSRNYSRSDHYYPIS
jgi:exonuclease VII large subunit